MIGFILCNEEVYFSNDKKITGKSLVGTIYFLLPKYKVLVPEVYFNSFTCRPGGKDCFNFSAFSLSVMTSVYRNREHRTLNFTFSAFFFILTLFASFLLAFNRKSLISVISRGILMLDVLGAVKKVDNLNI